MSKFTTMTPVGAPHAVGAGVHLRLNQKQYSARIDARMVRLLRRDGDKFIVETVQEQHFKVGDAFEIAAQ